ncbi:hypothetical protein AB0K48_29170 [Nonomuraea sp. NPDC055795]
MLAVLVRSDLSKEAELLVLRHENHVLHRRLDGKPRCVDSFIAHRVVLDLRL